MSSSVNLIACPACGASVSTEAATCPRCGHPFQKPAAASSDKTDLGFWLILTPLIGSGFLVFWVTQLNLLQSPMSKVSFIGIAVVMITGILAAHESSKNNAKSAGSYGPILWFVLFCFAWVIAMPWYCGERKRFGLPRMIFAGIASVAIFTGISAAIALAIESHAADVSNQFDEAMSAFSEAFTPEAEISPKHSQPMPAPTVTTQAEAVGVATNFNEYAALEFDSLFNLLNSGVPLTEDQLQSSYISPIREMQSLWPASEMMNRLIYCEIALQDVLNIAAASHNSLDRVDYIQGLINTYRKSANNCSRAISES